MKVVEIATSPRDGIDLGSLQNALDALDVAACIVMSNFQNPLGASMPDEKKRELVAMLAKANIPLIEDDVYAELYFGKTKPRPAKAFDRSGLVLHCGSFAKMSRAGLPHRLGHTRQIQVGGRAFEVHQYHFNSVVAAGCPGRISETRRL